MSVCRRARDAGCGGDTTAPHVSCSPALRGRRAGGTFSRCKQLQKLAKASRSMCRLVADASRTALRYVRSKNQRSAGAVTSRAYLSSIPSEIGMNLSNVLQRIDSIVPFLGAAYRSRLNAALITQCVKAAGNYPALPSACRSDKPR